MQADLLVTTNMILLQRKNKKQKAMPTGRQGFFLIEAVIASAIVATTLVMMLGAISNVVAISKYSLQKTQASYLLEEGVEVAKLLRNQSWTNISGLSTGTTYYMSWSGSAWSYTPTAPGTATGVFTRTIVFSSVSRDGTDTITASGGTADSGTRLGTVTVSWQQNGSSRTESLPFYITSTPSI